MEYKSSVALFGLLVRFGERLTVEALLTRSRRVQAFGDDPLLGVTVFISIVLLPVFAAFLVAWLVTGRGPAMRYLVRYAGSTRQRPPA
jgi:hypothetical protein